jgi:hypothetical protein
MQESFIEEFKWTFRHYVRLCLAPFVGAVKEFRSEFTKYGEELDARVARWRKSSAE